MVGSGGAAIGRRPMMVYGGVVPQLRLPGGDTVPEEYWQIFADLPGAVRTVRQCCNVQNMSLQITMN